MSKEKTELPLYREILDFGSGSEEDGSEEETSEEDGAEGKDDSDDALCPEEEGLFVIWQEANNRMPVNDRTDRNFLFIYDAPCDG